MRITKARVTLVKGQDNLLAYADITFDESFVVTSLRIINGRNGLFVAMPSRKRKDGTWQDIAHPITAEFRREINEAVLASYKSAVGDDDEPTQEVAPPPLSDDDDLPF